MSSTGFWGISAMTEFLAEHPDIAELLFYGVMLFLWLLAINALVKRNDRS